MVYRASSDRAASLHVCVDIGASEFAVNGAKTGVPVSTYRLGVSVQACRCEGRERLAISDLLAAVRTIDYVGDNSIAAASALHQI
jgi:hypothetical protein